MRAQKDIYTLDKNVWFDGKHFRTDKPKPWYKKEDYKRIIKGLYR